MAAGSGGLLRFGAGLCAGAVAQLVPEAHAGAAAGDTLVAMALAGTLFFDVPSTEARDNVALYLLITLAPFAVIGPFLGAVYELLAQRRDRRVGGDAAVVDDDHVIAHRVDLLQDVGREDDRLVLREAADQPRRQAVGLLRQRRLRLRRFGQAEP